MFNCDNGASAGAIDCACCAESREIDEYSNSKLMLDTVESVVRDDGFMMASVSAKKAREVCVRLNEWMKLPGNAISLNVFAERLVALLQLCLPTNRTSKRHREKMWTTFHQTRLSESFKELWLEFVSSAIQIEPPNLLFQHITDSVSSHHN